MKRIVCTEPHQFKVVETEIPVRTEKEALVKVKRIGICGTDLHAYQGNQPFFTYPRVLGHELSGYIDEVPESHSSLQKGSQVSIIPYIECGDCIACRKGKTNCCTDMRVMGVHIDGGMSEVIAVPLDHLLDTSGLSLDEAAMVEPLSIGAHAVNRAHVHKEDVVLVIGAGPIGLGVMAFAKESGATVIGMDISDERLDFAKKWANIDYTINGSNNSLEILKTLTNEDLPTIVFDVTGNIKSMEEAFHYPAHGGKLVYVGLVKSHLTFFNPEFHKKELTLLGSRNATKKDFYKVIEMLKNKKIDLELYITHRTSFEEMPKAFQQWLNPKERVIKAVIEI
ncbi:zinc-binding alcohol dehydrogenase family protein [Priestia filamentosa]|uniref:zinc-binding alcohol dehydrogenase family protein n=1 Tax=Priestia filamentosa TaxID=1402861 RepID=UPI001FB2B06D|nr:zinc-binding alcohol dehydrogenase family protein [Priestia filamentosa]UOE60205.1 zinc-binding alcohol dehydrogenase family protein [Priestia filamentosa]